MTDPIKTLFVAAALVGASATASAQTRAEDRCPRFVSQDAPRVLPATFRPAAIRQGEVSITYIGHSTFLIESAAGVRIATDYND
jgi:hypothetical protein